MTYAGLVATTTIVTLLNWLLLTGVTAYGGAGEFTKEIGEQMLSAIETLEHYVIETEEGQEVTLQCTSPESETILINENISSQACRLAKEITFKDYVGDVTVSCLMNVRYSREVQWFSCYLRDFQNSTTRIRVSVIPKQGKGSESVIEVDASKMPYSWCLSEPDLHHKITKPSAGHLLYFRWFNALKEGEDKCEREGGEKCWRPLRKVTKVGLWMKEEGDEYSCNNSNYRISGEFDCFGRLPTGLPSIQHCHSWSKAGVIIMEVLIYLLMYMGLVALYKYVGRLKRMLKSRSNGSSSNGQQSCQLLIANKDLKPYSGIEDSSKLILKDSAKMGDPSLARHMNVRPVTAV